MKKLIILIVVSLGICSVFASPKPSNNTQSDSVKTSSDGAGPGV